MTFTNFAFHDPFASFASSSLVRKRWGYDDLDEHNRPTKRVRSSPRIRQRRPRRAPPNPAASHSSLVVPSLTSHRPLLIPTIFRREQQEDLYYRHHDQYGRSFVPQPPNAVHTTVLSPMEDVEMLTPPPVPYTEEEYAAVCAAASAQMLEFSSPSPSPPSSAPAFICPGASTPGWIALCDNAGPSLHAACDDDGNMEVEEMEDQLEQPAPADSNIGASEKELVESRVDKGKTPTFVPELVLIPASPSLESPVMTHRINPALLFTAFQQPAPVQDVSEAGPSRSADKNVESASMGKGVRMTQARPTTTKIGSSTSSTNSNGRKKGKENVRPNAGTQAATAATDKMKRIPFVNVLNTSRSNAIPKPPVAASPKTPAIFVLPPALPPSSPTPPIQHTVFRDRPALVLPRSSRGARASSSAPAVVVEVEKEAVLEEEEPVPERAEESAPAALVPQTKLPGGVLRRLSGFFSSWLLSSMALDARLLLACSTPHILYAKAPVLEFRLRRILYYRTRPQMPACLLPKDRWTYSPCPHVLYPPARTSLPVVGPPPRHGPLRHPPPLSLWICPLLHSARLSLPSVLPPRHGSLRHLDSASVSIAYPPFLSARTCLRYAVPILLSFGFYPHSFVLVSPPWTTPSDHHCRHSHAFPRPAPRPPRLVPAARTTSPPVPPTPLGVITSEPTLVSAALAPTPTSRTALKPPPPLGVAPAFSAHAFKSLKPPASRTPPLSVSLARTSFKPRYHQSRKSEAPAPAFVFMFVPVSYPRKRPPSRKSRSVWPEAGSSCPVASLGAQTDSWCSIPPRHVFQFSQNSRQVECFQSVLRPERTSENEQHGNGGPITINVQEASGNECLWIREGKMSPGACWKQRKKPEKEESCANRSSSDQSTRRGPWTLERRTRDESCRARLSPRATGFAFSNTEFQALILTVARLLMTDRFFTADYTAAVDMSVIVDERDPQVKYTSAEDWLLEPKGHGGGGYNDTTTVSTKLSLNPKSSGPSISVYGTVGAGNGASMAFHVDQSPDIPYTAPATGSAIKYQLLWTSDVLPEGPHTLFITITSSGTSHTSQNIFLDYFLYNTTSTAGKTLFLDDNDARVVYSSEWNASSSEGFFRNTVHVSKSPSSTVSLTFEGNSVSLYGPITYDEDGVGCTASAVIDGRKPVNMTISHPTLTRQTIANSQLFTSGALQPGSHTIDITTPDDRPFSVDYFIFEAQSNLATVATSSSSATIPLSATQSSPFQSASPISHPTSQIPASPQTSRSPRPDILAIIFGAVAGVAVLTFIIVGEIFSSPLFALGRMSWIIPGWVQRRMTRGPSVTTLLSMDTPHAQFGIQAAALAVHPFPLRSASISDEKAPPESPPPDYSNCDIVVTEIAMLVLNEPRYSGTIFSPGPPNGWVSQAIHWSTYPRPGHRRQATQARSRRTRTSAPTPTGDAQDALVLRRQDEDGLLPIGPDGLDLDSTTTVLSKGENVPITAFRGLILSRRSDSHSRPSGESREAVAEASPAAFRELDGSGEPPAVTDLSGNPARG
ncbi:hypothetical protein DFH09DRAFT_1093324 [Mycena vulgaris]|nr:hypothetical protein DFH09DRAFT_1093324 [Mycena vulgaris]